MAFARNGYDATTNNEIALAAGITSGAIYHYFPSKAELYLAVFQQAQGIVHHRLGAAIAGCAGFGERIAAMVVAHQQLYLDDPSVNDFLVDLVSEAQRHPELAGRMAAMHRAQTRLLAGVVRDAVTDGDLPPTTDSRAVEDLLFVLLSGLGRFNNRVGDSGRQKGVAQAMTMLTRGALFPAR